MLEKIMDNVKRTLDMPINKQAKDLYFVIDRKTGKKVIDSTGKSFIITKNEIKKLKDEFTVISMVDDEKNVYEKKLENQRKQMEYDSMSDDEKNVYEKKLENQRKQMEYDSMSDDEKKELLKKRLDEASEK